MPYESPIVERADQIRQKGGYRRALWTLNRFLRQNPDEADAYNVRSLVHQERNDLEAAVEDLRSARRLETDNGKIAAYSIRSCKLNVFLRRFDDAARDYETAKMFDEGVASQAEKDPDLEGFLRDPSFVQRIRRAGYHGAPEHLQP